VNKLVAEDSLLEEAYRFAERLADGPPLVMRLIKRAVYQGLRADLRTSLDLISSHMVIVSEMRDHREGLAAFRERRKPVFEGK